VRLPSLSVQCLDGDCLGVADVYDFADGTILSIEADESSTVHAHRRSNATAAAAVDTDGRVVQRADLTKLSSTIRSDRLPGTHSIEQASHDDRSFFFPSNRNAKITHRAP